ncbi:unnamed protein product [Sphagnum jensenii]|uniref:F-box domain-containing protein n=1 Tax=Sphagnum jensenii TaxID=128206 RepID=A0ABP0WYR2_9BRYO
MDERLWCDLREELVDRVLARLPVDSFFRLRVVCKRWNAIMFSPGFLADCSQVSSSVGHYFIKADRRADRVLLGYSTTLAKWHRIAFDFLPMQIQPAASAGGLVCLVADYQPFALFVCNPITKLARQLPPRICKRRPRIVCMVVDRLNKAYKIIAAGGYRTDDDRWTTEVFDSVTSCWRVSGSLLQDELTKRPICCRGSLYCLTCGPNSGLLVFNVRDEVWSRVKTQRMPGNVKSRQLFECKGRIGIVGKASRNQTLGLCVWMLELKTMKWVEQGRMPPDMYDRLYKKWPCDSMYCAGHGDTIFFTRFFSPLGLTFSVSKNQWDWVPPFPLLCDISLNVPRPRNWSVFQHELDGFSFEPRLDATPFYKG